MGKHGARSARVFLGFCLSPPRSDLPATHDTQPLQPGGDNGPHVGPRRLRVVAVHGRADGGDEGGVYNRRGLRAGGFAARGPHAGDDHPRHAGSKNT